MAKSQYQDNDEIEFCDSILELIVKMLNLGLFSQISALNS
jgi:hypothetical protein